MGRIGMVLLLVALTGGGLPAVSRASDVSSVVPTSADPKPPTTPVRLIFIHHSTGENWLSDGDGKLGIALRDNNYFVSDTNYGWGPPDQDVGYDTIGDHTDIGHYYNWFAGPHASVYLKALYSESGRHSSYSRLGKKPAGENKIILFKSCFPNSNLNGNPDSPPPSGWNPLRGQDSSSQYMTVANAKGIYKDLLKVFKTHQDKLFVLITAPPLASSQTTAKQASNARALNNWLMKQWLKDYPYKNVVVYDFYNVLTSNGGSTGKNDLGKEQGNHHRWWKSSLQHSQTLKKNVSAYPSSPDDSHPSGAGNLKATGEFVKVLNVHYNAWRKASAMQFIEHDAL